MKKALSLVLTMCIVLSLFATFVISASAEGEVVTIGASYTASAATKDYGSWAGCSQNADKALTDGEKATDNQYMKPYNAYVQEGVVAYGQTVSVTVTLDKKYSLTEFAIYTIGGADGSANPLSLSVKVSEDGENWTDAGSTDTPVVTAGSNSWGHVTSLAKFTVTCDAVNATYVKYDIVSGGNQIFIDEVEAIGTEAKVEVEWKPFWLTHFNDKTAEGSGVIFTEAYTGAEWWYHVVFAPVAGEEGAYEITAISSGLDKGEGVAQAIPEGGFVYCLNYGNNYPEINADGSGIDYTSPNCNNMITDALTWKVGDKYMFKNVDLEGKTVPTSTEGTNWYDDAYVCTAQYAAYVPGYSEGEEGGEVVITKGDNVALNKTYTISGCGERTAYYAKLTDGVAKAELSYNNDEWFGFYCNGEDQSVINAPDKLGYVIIDLGASYDIYGVSVNFMDLAGDSGIFAPTAVNAYLSADGETWGDAVALTIPTETTKGVSYAVEGEVSGNARYVKVDVALGGTFAFLNEIEVYEAVKTVSGDNNPEVIVETITVDGNLNDTGWNKDMWTSVTPNNGYWQGVPTTDTISYKYQIRADETKLYVAFEIDCDAVEGGNGAGTNVRFWINTDEEATVYTHFYDVFKKDGAVATNAKYNTSKTENVAANIEESTINAAITSANGKTYVEFSVDLAEFGGEEGFNYYICVSNKVNENVCLYYPVVPTVEVDGNVDRQLNLPYKGWYTEGQATVDVEAIQLGEVVVDGGTDDNLGDAGIYAIAALAIVALIGTAVVIKRRA